MTTSIKVAACHVAPVFLDTAATVKKGVSLMKTAAAQGARLVVFPETWIPGFPMWTCLSSPLLNHDLFTRLAQQAIFIDGPEIGILRRTCKDSRIFASIGFNERSKFSMGGIWNSTVLISDQGEILNHHRKMVPTFYEKLVWANGDGAGLRVVDTSIGRIGGLICGENGNPLARYSLAAQAQQIHISHWPPIFPTRPPGKGGVPFNLGEATKIRAAAQAFEAKSFGIVCGSPVGQSAFDYLTTRDPNCAEILKDSPRSVTLFLDPNGTQIGDQLQGEEDGIAYAEFDLDRCIEPKQFHDFTGGYQRYDIFKFSVNRVRQEPVSWTEDPKPERLAWNDPDQEESSRS